MDISTPPLFPFRSVLNLKLLTEYWEKKLKDSYSPTHLNALVQQLNTVPELKTPIEDFRVLEPHRELIDFMMSAIIAPAFSEQEMIGAIVPFQFESFYNTPGFAKALPLGRLDELVTTNIPGNKMTSGKIMRACIIILNKFYNANIVVDKPLLFTVHDEATGLDKVYAVEINDRFCEVNAIKPLKPIEPKVIKFLTQKLFDLDLWLQYIHPEDFEFQGFMVLRLMDVTEQEMLSSIKYDLLKRNSVTDEASFDVIQQKLRSIFKIPDLRLGISYFDPNNNLIVNSGLNAWKSLCSHEKLQCVSYEGSIYERAWEERNYIIIENLHEYPFQSTIETALLDNNIKGILLAPMLDDEEIIGMVELATAQPATLNPINAHRVENILPMFTAAVKRVQQEMATEVRAIIQEECTAIHPSVQWRFFDAGVTLMNKRRAGLIAVLEEIVFKDVYPLFGLVDVRNSSLERNSSIQKDLQQNLEMAKDMLQKISAITRFPIIEELMYRTDTQLKKITKGLASGDESNLLDFLKTEINPVIAQYENESTLKKWVLRYQNHLDKSIGVVYRRRKAFEDSLALINKTLAAHVDEAQKAAQAMFPHYFEKYQTDGVEFTLYVGSTLVKDKEFNVLHLKNFRLWQLLTMCDIYRKMEELKPKLKNRLDVTQLILVHDQPLSIRFRPDEKQFDVDGAYDIRYEIVKKRIDKAYIKNTNERLTQPGKIAIVYSQGRIEDEYRRYFQYLVAKQIITDTIEEVELEELPGAYGLKALRIELVGALPEKAKKATAGSLLDQLEAVLNH
jgi:hypothetical protein